MGRCSQLMEILVFAGGGSNFGMFMDPHAQMSKQTFSRYVTGVDGELV